MCSNNYENSEERRGRRGKKRVGRGYTRGFKLTFYFLRKKKKKKSNKYSKTLGLL